MRLTMLLDMAVDGFGDRKMVGPAETALTAADLQSMARRGGRALAERGADSLLYLAQNGPGFPVAMFAAAYAGVPLIPVNYRLGEAQLSALLANHPGCLALVDPGQESRLPASMDLLTIPAWMELVADISSQQDEETQDPNPTAVVIYTSGTTSAPKAVLLKHENLVSYVLGSVEFAGAEESEAALVSVPPYHIAAVANVISNLFAGRRTVVLEQFSPQVWLDVARRERITNALVVPTMLSRIVEADGDKDVPTLRGLAYGGAPMPSALLEKALNMWPEVGFVNAYGLTETSSTVAVLGPQDHRDALTASEPGERARLGSVGRALPSVIIEIRDDQGKVVEPGVVGRIFVKGDQVSAEYAGIGRVTDDDGYFDTRDEGYLDEAGFLFIGGRTDDTIIRGAENIAPAEIEDVLLRHDRVVDAVVVGIPDEEWGQRLEAVVVPRGAATASEADLKAYVQSYLRSSKTPERIHFWSELPRTETGKLVRRDVVARIAENV